MFRSTPQGQYIPSKSQSVKPDVVSDVLEGDQIRMLLPSFLGFVDPRSTYLRSVIQVTGGRGTIVPEPEAGGIHSLFRNVLIRSGDNGCTIESLEDYNAQCGAIKPFTEQSSIEHKRALFEGVQSIPTKVNSLYYGAADSLVGSSSSAPVKTERVRNKAETYIQLESGLFKGGQIIPVGLMDGLRLQIDTEDASRGMRLLSFDGCRVGDTGASVYGERIRPSVDIADTDFARTGTAGLGQQFFAMTTTRDIIGTTQEGNPFDIGDILYVSLDDGSYEDKLGLIIGFYLATGNKLGVLFVPQRNTGVAMPNAYTAASATVFVQPSDRVIKHTGIIGESDLGNTGSFSLAAPTYTLSDIEMLAETVQPPDAYISGMTKKAMTEGGVSMDILSSELHRFNQTNAQGITQIQIPTLAKRAKSLIVQPLVSANYRNFEASSLTGVPDSARDYQFQFGSHLVPTRKASLQRYSQSPAKVEPLHITEVQKSLINISRPVFSLQNVDKHFLIARAFSRYGQVSDLSDETISLRVDYDSASQLKIFNNFIYKLVRIVISKGMVRVES